MRMRGVLAGSALLAVAALAGCGDDSGEGDDPAADESSSCPTFAVVPDDAQDAYKDYIVGFDLSLMRDPEARAERLADVSERLCLSVTEERQLSIDAVVVDSGRPLDAAGQQALVKALTSVDGITYAEPDQTVSIDPPGTPE